MWVISDIITGGAPPCTRYGANVNPGYMSTLVDELWWFPQTIASDY